MARTRKQWRPKRIRSEEDRRTGQSGFIRLEDGQKFLGYAMFDADPKKNDPGYYEYRMHWVPSAKRSVPCADEDCPLCEDGDKPREVAETLWLVIEDEEGNDLGDGELRTWRANSLVIRQFTEMRAEGEKIKGRQFRVTRASEKGDYVLLPKTKKLSLAEVKEWLLTDDAPDYDEMVTGQLNKMMEGIAISRALDEDDDDDDDEGDKPVRGKAAKTGKGKAKAEEPEVIEWPEEGEDEVVTVAEVDDENFLMVESESYDDTRQLWGTPDIDVTELTIGDEIIASWLTDADGDFVLSDDPQLAEGEEPEDEPEEPEEEPEGDDELPDEIEEETFVVAGVDEADSTIEVKSEELGMEFTLYFLDQGPASEVDFADYKEGAKIKVSAEKDSVGDMVATAIPEVVVTRRKRTTPASGGKKTAATRRTTKTKAAQSSTRTRKSAPAGKRPTAKRGTTRRTKGSGK